MRGVPWVDGDGAEPVWFSPLHARIDLLPIELGFCLSPVKPLVADLDVSEVRVDVECGATEHVAGCRFVRNDDDWLLALWASTPSTPSTVFRLIAESTGWSMSEYGHDDNIAMWGRLYSGFDFSRTALSALLAELANVVVHSWPSDSLATHRFAVSATTPSGVRWVDVADLRGEHR